VAGIALQRSRYVVTRLAHLLDTIVAIRATPSHWRRGLAVIERGRSPTGRRGVTAGTVALRIGLYVSSRLRLRILGYVSSAVTTDTLTCRTSMIHDCRRKSRSALVATVAIPIHGKEIGRDVAGRLGQCIGVSIQATMTRRTGQRRHYTVVHPCRRPASRIVTTVASGS
jgi:hypothetical protein